MAVRAQKQSDLEQLAQLLQLAGLASEPQIKQQEIANTKHGQDLQAALGVMGLQQQQQAEVSKDTLARLGLAQSGQQFQQGQELTGQKLAQEGQYQQGELAQQKAGNALTGQKIAQDATIAGQQQGIEQNRIDEAHRAANLEFLMHRLSDPNIGAHERQAISDQLAPDVGQGLQMSHDQDLRDKVNQFIGNSIPVNSSHDEIIKHIMSGTTGNPELQQALQQHWGLQPSEMVPGAPPPTAGTHMANAAKWSLNQFAQILNTPAELLNSATGNHFPGPRVIIPQFTQPATN